MGGAPKGPSWIHQIFWLELSAAYSHHNNDFYVDHLNNYNLLQFSARIGLREQKIGIEPYLFMNPIHDFSSNVWNKVDWNNNLAYGFGFRKRFYLREIVGLQFHELWFAAFAEKLWIHYFPNEFFFIGHRPRNDFKFGVAFQATYAGSGNKPSKTNGRTKIIPIWLETGGSLYYAKSSFYVRSKSGFYFAELSSSLGPILRFKSKVDLRPYAFARIMYDLGSNDWNDLDWHNNLRIGLGLRAQLFRFQFYQLKKLNFVISAYGEVHWMRWAKKVHYVPSYRPTQDQQAGVVFSISN